MTMLTARGLSKRFGGIQALDAVDVEIAEGSVRGIVGPNGSGKSTFVKCITGHVRPDRGQITYAGAPLALRDASEAAPRGIAIVAQELALAPEMTVGENIALAQEEARGPFVRRAATGARARRALAQLTDTIDLDAVAGELRPSEQRTVMIAAALFRDARLVIMDEPTAGMGLREAEEVLKVVGRLAGQGVTLIYVSHRLEEIVRVCDAVSLFRDGRVVSDLSGNALSQLGLAEAVSGTVPGAAPRTAGRAGARPPKPDRPVSLACRGVKGRFLDGLDLEAAGGEMVGVTGTLESGANELLELIAGVGRPLAGTLAVDGEPRRFAAPHDALGCGVGYLAAGRLHSAIGDQAIRENISLSRIDEVASGGFLVRRRTEREGTRPFADLFGLGARLDDDLATLSGGNQQKVLLARLLFAQARILVLDDPSLGVDVGARADLLATLRAVADDGRLVIVYSSEPPELIGFVDRLCVLRGGRIAAELRGGAMTPTAITSAMAGFA
jgi:ABC-type sugar transport system ATPase subunit